MFTASFNELKFFLDLIVLNFCFLDKFFEWLLVELFLQVFCFLGLYLLALKKLLFDLVMLVESK